MTSVHGLNICRIFLLHCVILATNPSACLYISQQMITDSGFNSFLCNLVQSNDDSDQISRSDFVELPHITNWHTYNPRSASIVFKPWPKVFFRNFSQSDKTTNYCAKLLDLPLELVSLVERVAHCTEWRIRRKCALVLSMPRISDARLDWGSFPDVWDAVNVISVIWFV